MHYKNNVAILMDSPWGTKPPALVLQCQKKQHHQEPKWMSRVPLTLSMKDEDGQDGLLKSSTSPWQCYPVWHVHNNPREEQLFPCVHTQISLLFCTHLSIIKCRNRGDVEIEEARLREQGRYGWRMEGKNEKERLVFMPGSQRACKSPRSVVEDSRRLIVIHHSWQPHRYGRAWQHSPVWEEQREGKQEKR